MKTKIYLLLIALVTAVGSVWGQDFEVDGLWYRELTSSTVAVVLPDTTKYEKYSGDIIIPPAVVLGANVYYVTEIGQDAFRRCNEVTSITIEGDNLEHIGGGAFFHCYGLKTITIPKSVTSIHSDFTSYCISLESVIVDPANTSFMNYNDDGVLYTTSTHASTPNRLLRYPPARSEDAYVIPDFVTSLHNRSFLGCLNLLSITIPKKITNINDALYGASFQSIKIEDGHDHFIEIDGVLLSKDGTTLVQYPGGKKMPNGIYNVPTTVTSTSTGAFAASSLKEVNFPSGFNSLGTVAFLDCYLLETVTGLDDLEVIRPQTFESCYSLTSFEFPKNLKTIELAAFLYSGLSGNVEIPKTVTTIADIAFVASIESFSIEGGDNAFFATDEFGVLYTATTPKKLVQYPSGKKLDSFSMPDDVEEIGRAAFWGVEIGHLTLSENLTTVGASVFSESKIGVLEIKSNTPPTTAPTAFNQVSEDMIIKVTSSDPTVIAAYEAFFTDRGGYISEYVVTFDYNDGITLTRLLGSDHATKKLRVELGTPSRSGYDFVGWYDEDGEKWVVGTVVSSDMVLTARWAVTPLPPVKAMYTVTITPLSGVRVNKTSTTIGEGNSFSFTAEAIASGYSVNVSVNGSPLSAISGITYLIEDIRVNKVVTFSLVRDGISPTPTPEGEGNNNGGGQIIIDDNTPSEIPGEFPPTGEIIVRPPLVDPDSSTPPTVIIDGKEVEGEWKTDEDGNPIFVIDYEDLEDGEHTLVINDKEYTFTTSGNNKTSNDVLSSTTITAGHGSISVSVAQPTHVQIVSMAGAVVYNAKVASETVVSLPQGLYIVKAGASGVKVVVR